MMLECIISYVVSGHVEFYRRSSLVYTASFQEEKDKFNIETDLAAVN